MYILNEDYLSVLFSLLDPQDEILKKSNKGIASLLSPRAAKEKLPDLFPWHQWVTLCCINVLSFYCEFCEVMF